MKKTENKNYLPVKDYLIANYTDLNKILCEKLLRQKVCDFTDAYASQFKQSQSPDKETPELSEMLDKEFPMEEPIENPKTLLEDNMRMVKNIINKDHAKFRAIATKFFLSGKGAQGRETQKDIITGFAYWLLASGHISHTHKTAGELYELFSESPNN